MVQNPTVRGPQRASHHGLFGWVWAGRAWIAAAVGILFILSTLYVLWAVQDLPDPSQSVLAAGDVIVLDRNGKLIEDWSPAGHYHVSLNLNEMGGYAPAATLAAEDRNFYHHGAIDVGSTARAEELGDQRWQNLRNDCPVLEHCWDLPLRNYYDGRNWGRWYFSQIKCRILR